MDNFKPQIVNTLLDKSNILRESKGSLLVKDQEEKITALTRQVDGVVMV